jgi:hypothetical protein
MLWGIVDSPPRGDVGEDSPGAAAKRLRRAVGLSQTQGFGILYRPCAVRWKFATPARWFPPDRCVGGSDGPPGELRPCGMPCHG